MIKIKNKYWVEDPHPDNQIKTYYLYFIKCNNYIKIGYSENPKKRLEVIQVSNPYRCNIILTIGYLGETDAKNHELYWHKLCKEFKVRGEWFKYKKGVEIWLKDITG